MSWLSKTKRARPAKVEAAEVAPEKAPGKKNEENPYLATRGSWNSLMTALQVQNNLLKIGLIVAGLVVLVSVVGISQLGLRSKFVPYVVEVNKFGDALAIDPAVRAVSAMDPRIVRSTLTSWITAVRSVTPDIAMERRNIYLAYAYVREGDPAKTMLNEWFDGTPGTDPISRSRKELVDVTVGSIVEMTAHTWQVDWRETTRKPDGTVVMRKHFRAYVDIYVDQKIHETESEIRLNPLGLYIKYFHWTELSAK